MEVTKEHIRHILVYEFNKGNNATESARNIIVYGDRIISGKPVSTVVPEIPRKLQPKRQASSCKICRARQERPANPGRTKSCHNCWRTPRSLDLVIQLFIDTSDI